MAEPQERKEWCGMLYSTQERYFVSMIITAHMLACTKPAQDPGGQCSSMGMGGTREDPQPAEELLGANSC